MNNVERIFSVAGETLAISLQRAAWAAFDDLCCREGLSEEKLCAKAAAVAGTAPLADKIGEMLTRYFKDMVENDVPPPQDAGPDDCTLSPALRAALAAVGRPPGGLGGIVGDQVKKGHPR